MWQCFNKVDLTIYCLKDKVRKSCQGDSSPWVMRFRKDPLHSRLLLRLQLDPVLISDLASGLCPEEFMCTVNLWYHLAKVSKVGTLLITPWGSVVSRNLSALRVTLRVVPAQQELLECSHCRWESSVGPGLSSIYNKMIDWQWYLHSAKTSGSPFQTALGCPEAICPQSPQEAGWRHQSPAGCQGREGAAHTTQPAN